MNSVNLHSAISSPESASGATPFAALDGPTTAPCGQEAALANLSARQAKELGRLTSGTYGPLSTTSSKSAALAQSLANKLMRLSAKVGSTLYKLTWKESVTPSGRPVSRLVASVLRTSAKGSTSLPLMPWPTPCSQDGPNGGPAQGSDRLPGAAGLASWPTPQAFDATNDGEPRPLRYKGNAPSEAGNTRDPNKMGSYCGDLKDYAGLALVMAPWVTPSSRDWKDSPGMATVAADGRIRLDQLPRLATLAAPQTELGETPTGSTAEIKNTGQLNPALSRWLMGLPPEWDVCAATVTPLSRRSPKRS
jgi:hypothetical protein